VKQLVLAIFALMGFVLLVTELSVRRKFKKIRDDPATVCRLAGRHDVEVGGPTAAIWVRCRRCGATRTDEAGWQP
jgi:hypothetical protein